VLERRSKSVYAVVIHISLIYVVDVNYIIQYNNYISKLLAFLYPNLETIAMFLDSAIIDVTGGTGGHGCVSWRREKFIPKGGPDGGNGGNGGNVYMVADANTDTLSSYASKKKYKGENGKSGEGRNKYGKAGEDLYLSVPPGTTIREVSSKGEPVEGGFEADLQTHGDQITLVHGGRGGYGNAHFKSSVRQRPDFAEKGEPGESRHISLELKLVADVGIIGYPSAGKSTLISVISAAKPKIADYEFTTLVPNLGVVNVDDRSFVACDVPGLIEGAHEGKGLGHQFLRHIERCGLLIHMLDVSRCLRDNSPDPDILVENYEAIRKELSAHSPALAAKKELIVLNKIDLIPHQLEDLKAALHERGIELFLCISAATSLHTDELKNKLMPIVLEERQKREETDEPIEELQVLSPHLETNRMGAYRIETEESGALRIHGKRLEQLTVMTDFESESALQRYRDVCDRVGLTKAIHRAKAGKSIPVFVGNTDISLYV